MNRNELQRFRDTIFKILTVLVGAILALLTGVVQWESPPLILLLPIPVAMIILATLAYADWRWELIQVTANIEKAMGERLPENCRYECIFVERHPRGEFGGMSSESFNIILLLTIAALVLFYLIATPMFLR